MTQMNWELRQYNMYFGSVGHAKHAENNQLEPQGASMRAPLWIIVCTVGNPNALCRNLEALSNASMQGSDSDTKNPDISALQFQVYQKGNASNIITQTTCSQVKKV